jgi:hypothetical protein
MLKFPLYGWIIFPEGVFIGPVLAHGPYEKQESF